MSIPSSDSPVNSAGRPVASADVSRQAYFLDVQGPGANAWAWVRGERIPEHLAISLEPILPGDTAELPFMEGGLLLRVEARDDGWTIRGYPATTGFDGTAAARSNETRTAFIATLSHEIRTPLGSVHGFANLLRRELDDIEQKSGVRLPDQLREFADAIAGESGRLLEVVNDLFDHANLESGHFNLRSGTADLGAHVESAMERIRPELSRKNVQLAQARIDSGLIVSADPGRIDRILDGLLSNAAKFTHEGSVVVSARAERRADMTPDNTPDMTLDMTPDMTPDHTPGNSPDNLEAVVEVTDTGIGISESYQANLFEAFSQEEDWRVRMHGGAGLGLALISRTLDLMGGSISVTSRKGHGSTFTVRIPLAGKCTTDSVTEPSHSPVRTAHFS